MEKVTLEEMLSQIDGTLAGNSYGIGIHGVSRAKGGKTKEEALENMMRTGINITEGNSVLATVSSLGTSTELSKQQKQTVENYHYGREQGQYNVIVATPTIMEAGSEKMYLGFPDINTDTAGNQYKTTCVLDYLCCEEQKQGHIPREFILGYYMDEEYSGDPSSNRQVKFIKNDKHYSNLSEQERKQLFDNFNAKLKGKYKEISDAVVSKDKQALSTLVKQEEELNAEALQTKKRELLEKGIVNKELTETLAATHSVTAAKQAQVHLMEQERDVISNIRTVGSRRKIPIGLLNNSDTQENEFIHGLQSRTNSQEEIEEFDRKNPTIMAKEDRMLEGITR